jgi:hypothetical protein
MTGSTYVRATAPPAGTDVAGTAEATAAMAAGMAAAQARQDHLMQNARDGHAGDLREAPSTLEPFFPSDRGDGPGV